MATKVPLQRTLGRNGPVINPLGFGAMGLSDFYKPLPSEEEAIALLNHVIDAGCSFIDTSDVYGPFTNEILLGKVLKTRRSEVFLCTKFGVLRDPTTSTQRVIGKPEYVRQCCEASLKRLGVDYIDLYYQHRIDPDTPIEETVGAMAELVKEGKVRYLGLSECSAATLRRAYKVHPIAAVQIEFSPWTLDIEQNGLLETCRELGVSIVAYAPLGRGFLTGAIKSPADFEPSDYRRSAPRFSAENFPKNIELVEKLKSLAATKGCTVSQFVLAWVLAQGDDFITIPGTHRVKGFDENYGSLKVQLTKEDHAAIRDILKSFEVHGTRYTAAGMAIVHI